RRAREPGHGARAHRLARRRGPRRARRPVGVRAPRRARRGRGRRRHARRGGAGRARGRSRAPRARLDRHEPRGPLPASDLRGGTVRTALLTEYRKLATTRLWWVLLLTMAVYMAFLGAVIAFPFTIEGGTAGMSGDPSG